MSDTTPVQKILPTALGRMMTDSDPEKVKRVSGEMLRQIKFDIAKLEAAFEGRD